MAHKILSIEDNPNNMQLIQRVFESYGYELCGAVNGLDGVSMAEEIKPDMVLIDINLLDIDGYEVAHQIRANREVGLHTVPLIAVTADVLKGDAEKCLAAACDAYLPKPVNIRELITRVDSLLSDDRM